ncbi:hypothetical protein PAPHI01_2432 [Pancytospora philotis]|nr:hypothetical protein PAPHI01_2432 [Pancytospora philotis]
MRWISEILFLLATSLCAQVDAERTAHVLACSYMDAYDTAGQLRSIHVEPSGPLNLLNGHPQLNDGVIKSQLESAALMPADYAYGSEVGSSAYERTQSMCEGAVRVVPYDPKAAKYLFEYYTVLKALFTNEGGPGVVDKSSRASFYNFLKGLYPRKAERIFVVLLVLTSGVDIQCERRVVAPTGIDGEPLHTLSFVIPGGEFQLELGALDADASRVVDFFIACAGEKAREIDSYGLGYTYSPNFLIQSLFHAFIKSEPHLEIFFCMAEEFVYKLSAKDRSHPLWLKLFTMEEERALECYQGLSTEFGKVE